MLHYAETTNSSTIVSVPSLPQNQSQEHVSDSFTSMLYALLTHPEFQKGICCAQDNYFDSYDEAPLTENEMIKEVEMNLSRHIVQADRQHAPLFGVQPPSYLENLGWVIGTIAKGLTYAR